MANCGTHTFTIKWDQLQKLSETNNELDVSQTFSIAALNWRIECSNVKGSFVAFLTLMEIPSQFMSYGWAEGTMTIEEIKNLQIEQISIKINVKILRIYSIKNELLFSGILSIKSPNEIK
eukprot:56582_1